MKRPLQRLNIRTTWGTIEIELLNDKVSCCHLPLVTKAPESSFAIKSSAKDPVSRFVAAAFSGEKGTLPPIHQPEGTPFQQEVWRAIATIAPGKTKTYGELAQAIGRPKACRAVANACGKNPLPIFIPCHRVVAANGGLGGFSSGLPWKRLLLSTNLS